MYKCTLYDTTRFKAVMAMNLSELRSQASRCESNPRMGDLLGSLVWGAKSGQYCVIEGGSLQYTPISFEHSQLSKSPCIFSNHEARPSLINLPKSSSHTHTHTHTHTYIYIYIYIYILALNSCYVRNSLL